jgi:hypothetical protein
MLSASLLVCFIKIRMKRLRSVIGALSVISASLNLILARKYGVGHDTGLVRLYLDTYPQFDSRVRGEGPYFIDPGNRNENYKP